MGRFYLNRKEGYGHLLFPDGSLFQVNWTGSLFLCIYFKLRFIIIDFNFTMCTVLQGLYNCDQRFGPGVMNYPDGQSDVGFWVGERLLRLCAPVEDGFSLKNLPEYAAYIGFADSSTKVP